MTQMATRLLTTGELARDTRDMNKGASEETESPEMQRAKTVVEQALRDVHSPSLPRQIPYIHRRDDS